MLSWLIARKLLVTRPQNSKGLHDPAGRDKENRALPGFFMPVAFAQYRQDVCRHALAGSFFAAAGLYEGSVSADSALTVFCRPVSEFYRCGFPASDN